MAHAKYFSDLTQQLLQGLLLSKIHDILVLTDKVEYNKIDQVFPMYPEQFFFSGRVNA